MVEMLANRFNFLGNLYYYLNDYEEAIRYSELLLNKINEFQGNLDNTIVPLAMNKIGACFTNLQEYDKAAEKLELALEWFKFNIQSTDPFEIEGNKNNLLITLYFKAKNNLQRYLKYGCEEDLEQAHADYDVCIRLIDHIISSFDDSDSRQYLVDRFYYIFESIIEVNYQFYQLGGERKYVDRAMRYMEKSRSILLKEMMQHAKAVIRAGIPDTMLAQERGVREQIAGLENRKYESERKLPAGQQSDLVFHQLNDSLFILREQYWALLKQIEQRYPEYYTMKHADRSTETAAIVNRLLQPQEALVQYFVGDDHIYTLVYRGDGAYTMTKAPVDDLDSNVKALRENIYGYVLTPADSLAKAYGDGAYHLYQKLLQPISGYLPYRVTIIPDGLLEYLPFEALLTAKADPNSSFRAWPYCLRKYSFCYAHSVLSLEEMRQRQNRPKYRQVLAIAPSFSPALAVRSPEERRRSFGALEDNLVEVAGIRDLFPAKTLVGREATVASFKALAGDYAVLHLATHAKADNENGEYAYVAFSETNDTATSNLLYLKHLYTLPLHADMVTLSACETGVGKLRRGEGVVSLARGFSYAGANSLVTTLWRISDRESATLMQRYYQGLKNDLSKDEALRQAKLNYLDEASGNRAHPFFWAAFVTIGDMEPLDLPDGGWMWWLLAGLLPVGYWVWRKLRLG
jgi:CHAT domain-containing protein